MTPRLSTDIEQFIAASADGSARIEGSDGAVYWVLTDEAMRIREYVREGIVQANNGETEVWDVEAIKTAGRELKSQRST